MTAELEGARILVVEDEFLVAMLLEEMLEAAGCVVAGPIPRIADALAAVYRETYDAAVLDINLAGERIDPVADALSQRNIPFMFVTGYSAAAVPGGFTEHPRLCKPFKMADLLSTLMDLMHPASRRRDGRASNCE